jgi:hypothetical protein
MQEQVEKGCFVGLSGRRVAFGDKCVVSGLFVSFLAVPAAEMTRIM